MKAIDIIKEMVYDPELAESSDLWVFHNDDEPGEWVNRIFGDYHVHEGDLRPAIYLAIFQWDGENLTFIRNAPDVTLLTNSPEEHEEDDQKIYLWRVEE